MSRRFVPTIPTSLTDDNTLMGKILGLNDAIQRIKHSLFWGVTNALIFLFVSYDFYYTSGPWFDYFHCFEGACIILTASNTIFYFFRYIRNKFQLTPVYITQEQKYLIGARDSDPYIKLYTPTKPVDTSMSSMTPLNLSSTSWLSPSTSLNASLSPNYSMSSPSWVYYQGSPDPTANNISPSSCRHRANTLNPVVLASSSPPGEMIENELSLSRYLREFENYEKCAAVSMSVEQPSTVLSSFWTHPATRNSTETSPMLRRCTYQMAPPTPPQVSSDNGGVIGEGNLSPLSALQYSQDMWRKVGVNTDLLTQWSANLRMWISRTVLKRIVEEIGRVDKALYRQGFADVHVGAVGLERLKRTAQITAVAQNIPSLQCLIAFLDVTAHQEYLVSRIKDLAKGGCMSDFRWNGGGSYQGKNWEDHLPTDSAVVLHMLATYLDSQLPPLPSNPDGRPFTSQYIVRASQKPGPGLAICETRVSPPNYAVSLGGPDGGMLRPSPGQSNMFHAILLFIHVAKTRESAMIGRVNLGPSGINLLWVVES